MGKRGHSEEEILRVLREAESGDTVVEVCRKHGISQQSFYCGRRSMRAWDCRSCASCGSCAMRTRKLKRLVADLSLDRHILRRRSSQKNCKASCATRPGGVGASCPRLSQRRAARLIPIERMTLRYTHDRGSAGGLASSSARAGREPCALRLPAADGATRARGLAGEREADLPAVPRGGTDRATQKRRERAQRATGSRLDGSASQPKVEHGFRRAELPDGRWIRVLSVVDQYTRECLTLEADNALSGE